MGRRQDEPPWTAGGGVSLAALVVWVLAWAAVAAMVAVDLVLVVT